MTVKINTSSQPRIRVSASTRVEVKVTSQSWKGITTRVAASGLAPERATAPVEGKSVRPR